MRTMPQDVVVAVKDLQNYKYLVRLSLLRIYISMRKLEERGRFLFNIFPFHYKDETGQDIIQQEVKWLTYLVFF